MLCAIYAVRVEFMARHVPSQAGNVTHDLVVTLLSHHFHLSIAPRISARRSKCVQSFDHSPRAASCLRRPGAGASLVTSDDSTLHT